MHHQSGLNSFVKVILLCLSVSTLCTWVILTTTGWGVLPKEKSPTGSNVAIGLWRICTVKEALPFCTILDGTSIGWLAATQALLVLVTFCATITFILKMLKTFLAQFKANTQIDRAWIYLPFMSGGLLLVGTAIFTTGFKSDYIDKDQGFEFGFSWFLSWGTVILHFTSGIVEYQRRNAGTDSDIRGIDQDGDRPEV